MTEPIRVFVVVAMDEGHYATTLLYRNATVAQRHGIDAATTQAALEDPGVEQEDPNSGCTVTYQTVEEA